MCILDAWPSEESIVEYSNNINSLYDNIIITCYYNIYVCMSIWGPLIN